MENYLLYGWGQPKEINPRELSHLTYGAVDPVENVKTGMRQAAEQTAQKGKEAVKWGWGQALQNFTRKAIKTNPVMGLPLILKGSSRQFSEEPDSLRLERFK